MHRNYSKASTKAERQKWWFELDEHEREDYISRRMKRKAEKRKKNHVRVQIRQFVTKNGRKQWLKRIIAKNPWLIERSVIICELLKQ